MKKQLGEVWLEAVQGDIVNQPDVDAVVNAANAMLIPGGGVAGAIHKAAGPELEKECKPLAPIRPGEAVITTAHNLPNKHIIHALGPVYGVDKPENLLLAECYRNILILADEHNIESIALPAISTGAFGYPFEAATDISLEAVTDTIPSLKYLKLIRFILFGDIDFDIYIDRLRNLKG